MPGTLTTTGSIDVNSLPSTPAGSNLIGQVELSDGTNPIGVTGNPLIVDGSAVSQPVSGTLAISNFPASQPVTGPLTDTELRASAVPVDASGATVPVSGPLTNTELRATAVDVAGPLTDTELRATAVPVSGPLTNTELRAASVPVSGPLTNTELRAAAVPVSGPLTDTQLRATAVPVSGTFYPTTQPVSIAATVGVKQVPQTSGGLPLPFSASVNATKQQVKGSAGQIYGWQILNTTSAIAYVQVFDKTSANVTVGTTAPDYVIPLPANGTTGAGAAIEISQGISHANGITIACTTTRTGSTGAACDVLIMFN